MTVDFSSETMGLEGDIFQVLKEKNSISKRNILQEWRANQDILRLKKTKKIYQ